MNRKARFPAMLVIALVAAVVDHLSKSWFLKHFQVGESRRVFSWFYLTLVQNTGTAFGLFQDNNRALLMLSYIVLVAFIYGARGLWERGGGWAFWGVALIMGGAIGNILDRHLYGHVIDFLDFRVWPVFNLADSAITTGAIVTAIGVMVHQESE